MREIRLQFVQGLAPWNARALELRLGGDPGLLLLFAGDYTPPAGGNVVLGFGGATEAVELPRELVLDAQLMPPSVDARLAQGGAIEIAASLVMPVATVRAQLELIQSLSLEVITPPVSAEIRVEHGVSLSLVATLGAPAVVDVALTREINVFRGPSDSAGARFENAVPLEAQGSTRWEQPARPYGATASAFEQGATLAASQGGQWSARPRTDAISGSRWEQAERILGTLSGSRWLQLPRVRRASRPVWEQGQGIAAARSSGYQHPPRNDARRRSRYEEARTLEPVTMDVPYQQGRTTGDDWRVPWEQARRPPPGIDLPPDPPEPPVLEPVEGSTTLQFCHAMPSAPWVLQFGLTCEIPTPTIPVKRLYIVQNSARLVRLSDGLELPATQMTLSIDADSWAWSFSAGLAGRDAQALVTGTDGQPVEVMAEINGEQWRCLVDGWRRSESWQSHSVTISGRSLAAYLGAPYATARSYTEDSQATASQLARAELPEGWSLDWRMTDWVVPAGAWSYDSLAPIDAISRIAQAAGGYVQAHQQDQTIIVAPRFEAAPWRWAESEVDLAVPRDIITQLGSDQQPGDARNAVWLHGDTGGIQAQIIRQGTAGDQLAPTVVDALITDQAPAQSRGIAELAATLRQSTESLQMPLAASLGGLLLPGMMIECDGWRGVSRGVSVSASLQGRALSVRQSIELQRFHL
ncbi:hypothetical protein R1T44_07010 [Cobetia amphilecti]|uniref:hypothetical protein n=1 Tax=Cobetia TaxID=204286 RepID=UPI0029421CE8|nr:hypothetical protein [Cobetia amphilecti]WOI27124.1 hypothetical protein R1T44_07010 [Cobetia amphilecti]